MRILITGAAGYIGSVMVPELLKDGHAVTAVDNFMYGQTGLLDCCGAPGLKVVRGDARDEALVNKHMQDAELIIPLACLTGAPLCSKDPWAAKEVISDAVAMILRNRQPGQKIIYPTTNSGYGIGEKDKYCDEDTPLNPISLYGKLKVEAEKMILDAGESITLRLATVFGSSPRMRLDLLVNDFTYRAVNDGFIVLFEAHFKRNYIHIRDVVKAFKHCIKNFSDMRGQTYNVGLSDCNIDKWELCEEIKKQVPDFVFIKSEIGKDIDKRDYIVSNEKIEKSGYKPDHSLRDGIKELLNVYQVIRRDQYSNI